MRCGSEFILLLTIFCSVCHLVSSIWPGAFADNDWSFTLIFAGLLLVPVIGFIVIYILYLALWEWGVHRPATRAALLRLFASGGVVLITLLISGLPLHTAFRIYGGSFEDHRKTIKRSRTPSITPVNQRLGLWQVDEYRTDGIGGVYYRIGTGSSFIDIISLGFAYRPEKDRSPYGSASYRLARLRGDWYYFSVSDDY